MKRHEAGEAKVIPIILRDTNWQEAPFAKLQSLPTTRRAVAGWRSQDDAFLDIVNGIRTAVQPIKQTRLENSRLLERRRKYNLYDDFLRDIAVIDPDAVELPKGWVSGAAVGKSVDSLDGWASVALATRCAERVSSILSHWPLRKHCAESATRVARGYAIRGADFHEFDYHDTTTRIDELTGIGRAAFDAGAATPEEEEQEDDEPALRAAYVLRGRLCSPLETSLEAQGPRVHRSQFKRLRKRATSWASSSPFHATLEAKRGACGNVLSGSLPDPSERTMNGSKNESAPRPQCRRRSSNDDAGVHQMCAMNHQPVVRLGGSSG